MGNETHILKLCHLLKDLLGLKAVGGQSCEELECVDVWDGDDKHLPLGPVDTLQLQKRDGRQKVTAEGKLDRVHLHEGCLVVTRGKALHQLRPQVLHHGSGVVVLHALRGNRC